MYICEYAAFNSDVEEMEFVLQFPISYEKTSKVSGVLLLAHGCQHSVWFN